LAVNVAGLAANINTFVMARLQDGAALRAAILAFAKLRWIEKAPLNRAPDPMHSAKAGPDTCLCGGRLELGRHLDQELLSLALINRRSQGKQQVHLFGSEAERHVSSLEAARAR
jgi:hypothetical protein